MEADSKVALIFAGFAVVIGTVAGILQLDPLLSLVLGLLFFYVAYRASPRILDLEDASFDTGPWNMIKTGVIPYWFLWLVFWTLVFTLNFF